MATIITSTMRERIIASIKNFLVNFTQTQLVVTIVALPILVSWGLGVSVVTFVGNLIFAPVLTIFLILSSLLLFTELFNIPNSYLAYALDYFTRAWHTVMQTGDTQWLIEFAHPGRLMLFAMPLVMFFALRHRSVRTNKTRIIALSTILGLSIIALYAHQKYHQQLAPKEVCYQEKLKIKRNDDLTLTIVDDGFFNKKRSAEKMIAFELKPYLIKTFGSPTIAEIKLLRPGQSSFVAAKELCSICTVKKVSLPFFNPTLSKAAWRQFFELRRTLEEKKIVFERYEPLSTKKIFKNRRDRRTIKNHFVDSTTNG